jgi:hypothetical protein
MNQQFSRRRFGQSVLALSGAAQILRGQESMPPSRAITSGDRQHWFGYYDKWQTDPSGRFALGGQVETFFRSPSPDDRLRVGLIELDNENRRQEIGTSTSWGWQQGCMMQWIPGSSTEVIWNDHGENGFVSRIHHVETGETRTLPRAVYTLDPKGEFALCVDFERLQFFRPGYGYPARQPRQSWEKAPADSGIFRMDLRTGESELILSFATIAALARGLGSVADHFHWFNHLLINPSGDRFIFLNRSRPVASMEQMREYLKANPHLRKRGFSSSYVTRALTANTDGSEVYPLNDSGMFSHFIWKGDDEICAWAVPEGGTSAAFFDFEDRSKNFRQVGAGVMTLNGHNTYVPGTGYEWILNDTYPQGRERLQELYLFHVPSGKKVSLGKFHEPEKFSGEWRCDLHPRCDQQGKTVFFDSTHQGDRRQMYALDISGITG